MNTPDEVGPLSKEKAKGEEITIEENFASESWAREQQIQGKWWKPQFLVDRPLASTNFKGKGKEMWHSLQDHEVVIDFFTKIWELIGNDSFKRSKRQFMKDNCHLGL